MKSNEFNLIDHYMERHCLPGDYSETVVEILEQDDKEQIHEDLNFLDGHCYRMDPNNPRYADQPGKYPQDVQCTG